MHRSRHGHAESYPSGLQRDCVECGTNSTQSRVGFTTQKTSRLHGSGADVFVTKHCKCKLVQGQAGQTRPRPAPALPGVNSRARDKGKKERTQAKATQNTDKRKEGGRGALPATHNSSLHWEDYRRLPSILLSYYKTYCEGLVRHVHKPPEPMRIPY